MLKVEILGPPETRSFQSKDGRNFTFVEQPVAYFMPGDKYPTPGKIRVPDDIPQGYEVGKSYQLGPRSFFVNRYGALAVGDLELVALEDAKGRTTRAA